MENEILRLCGIAVLCAVTGAVLSGIMGAGGLHGALRLSGLLLVFCGALLLADGAIEQIFGIGEAVGATEYVSVMLRGLALAVLCRICSDICRECGQTSLASAVESAGKLCMVLLALPIIGDIMEYAGELLERI